MVAAVVQASGVAPQASGKPDPGIFHAAARRAGAQRPMVVGDRLETDLAGARNAHYPGLFVMTGVSTPLDLLQAPPGHRPTYVGADLRALADHHPRPARDADWHVVGRARARLVGDTIILADDGEPAPLDRLRALATLAWACADAAAPLPVAALEDALARCRHQSPTTRPKS
jgi:hypothetical protein